MESYKRSPEMTEKLIAAISFALRAHPEQRLGQLITNIPRIHMDLGDVNIWNLYDEKWLELLTKEEGC